MRNAQTLSFDESIIRLIRHKLPGSSVSQTLMSAGGCKVFVSEQGSEGRPSCKQEVFLNECFGKNVHRDVMPTGFS